MAASKALPQRPGSGLREIAETVPEDILAGEVVAEIEGAGIAEIARDAKLAFDFVVAAIAEFRSGLTGMCVEVDAGAGVGREFESELLFVAGEGGGFDEAAGEDGH